MCNEDDLSAIPAIIIHPSINANRALSQRAKAHRLLGQLPTIIIIAVEFLLVYSYQPTKTL
jgi:hypothetical protein